MGTTRTIVMGLAAAGAALLGGCAVYPTPYGPAIEPAPVAVAPAPVYVGPPAVVVRPAPYYYGGYGGGYHRGYYGGGRRYYRGGW
ncbi:hypothetical protein SAMN05216321_113148 [Cupriavidus sp. OV038]|nr:hypothetical protein SAMN05216321_113148 [Cupriavidus sp. OV038]SFP86865.1 hypothetical protein SAMN05216322_11239 [Cupriavidus sp. OV096]